jgi:hypothetical protein
MLSTACAKLAFCLLVYRVCSLFVLPSETEHQHWVAFAHQTGPPPEYNEINAGTHVCAILSGRPLVVPRWTLFLGWSSGCLGWPSGMILECFLGCPHVSTFPMRKIARTHLYNSICLMCPPTPSNPAIMIFFMCYLIVSPLGTMRLTMLVRIFSYPPSAWRTLACTNRICNSCSVASSAET